MLERIVRVRNSKGIHIRPGQEIVQTAEQFLADVFLQNGSKRINAKSMLGIMGLVAGEGTDLKIITDGPDEAEALQALADLIESGFGEELEEE